MLIRIIFSLHTGLLKNQHNKYIRIDHRILFDIYETKFNDTHNIFVSLYNQNTNSSEKITESVRVLPRKIRRTIYCYCTHAKLADAYKFQLSF